MRFAWCITDLDPGGAERALLQIAQRLPASDWQQHVFCLSGPGALVEPLQQAGIGVTCLDARSRYDVGVLGRLTRKLREFQPDLLQTFLFHANVAGCWAGWRAGVPHIVTGIRVAEQRSGWYGRLERWSCRNAEAHVCVSEGVAQFARNVTRLPAEKVLVIPNGVDCERFANATPMDLSPWGIVDGDQVWVTVGRLDPQKGPEILLSAVEQLAARYPRLKLLWAGTGPLQGQLEQSVEQRGLSDRVRFLGWCDDIPGLLQAAQGFVLTSLWEGMPNAVLEAQAAGLPVLVSEVEGSTELITPGVTGELFPKGEITVLIRQWELLLGSENRRKSLGANAQAAVRANRSWGSVGKQYADLYRRILTNVPCS